MPMQPQGLKPAFFAALIGTAEAVPYHESCRASLGRPDGGVRAYVGIAGDSGARATSISFPSFSASCEALPSRKTIDDQFKELAAGVRAC
jgi:hypothetical protein